MMTRRSSPATDEVGSSHQALSAGTIPAKRSQGLSGGNGAECC
jgi:hypothetical protein